MSPSKITNPAIMEPSENDLENFRITTVKQVKGDMNILQENKNKQVNEIKKSYQDMTRSKLEIGLLKGNQTEMMLEMTNAVSQIETLMESFTKRMNGSCEKQRTGLKDKVEELIAQ